MYRLPGGIKKDPVRRWALTDRVFFGRGACHILAGVFLERHRDLGFDAFWIRPDGDAPGAHVFVSDGRLAFDHHGYSAPERLVRHHRAGWCRAAAGWSARIERVDFPLLDRHELNARKMLGPAQYLDDPRPRAERFIDRFEARRLELTAAGPTGSAGLSPAGRPRSGR